MFPKKSKNSFSAMEALTVTRKSTKNRRSSKGEKSKAPNKIKKQPGKTSPVSRMRHYNQCRALTVEEMMDSVDDDAPAFVQILNQVAQNPAPPLALLDIAINEILSGVLENMARDELRIYRIFRTKNRFYGRTLYYRKLNFIYSNDPDDAYIFQD